MFEERNENPGARSHRALTGSPGRSLDGVLGTKGNLPKQEAIPSVCLEVPMAVAGLEARRRGSRSSGQRMGARTWVWLRRWTEWGHIQGRFWSWRHQELRARIGEEREGGLKGELEPRSPLPGVRLSRQARDLSLGVQPTFCHQEELDFAKMGEAFCYTTSVSWNNCAGNAARRGPRCPVRG